MLLRSIFWLAVAFVFVGPQVDIGSSLRDISNGTIEKAQQFGAEQTDIRSCGSVDCVGQKLIVSAGMNAVSGAAGLAIENLISPGEIPGINQGNGVQIVSPQPRPRIFRAS